MHGDREYRQATRDPDDVWVGTIAAERRMIGERDDLHELAGLGSNWTILAVDLHWLKTDNQRVDVYAVDREAVQAPEHDDLRRLGRGDGLPVTCITLTGVTATQVIERCLRNTRINLQAGAFEDDKIYVVDKITHPPID